MDDDNTATDNAVTVEGAVVAEVSVTGPGVSITRSVDQGQLASIVALLFGVPLATPKGNGAVRHEAAFERRESKASRSEPATWEEDLTLGEFIIQSGAHTFPQKICAAGYFLINMRGAESFNRETVRSALVEAHEDLPGNFPRDWGRAASSHLIAAKPGSQGEFYVPKTGRTAVESHFEDSPKPRPARRATKKSTASGDGA